MLSNVIPMDAAASGAMLNGAMNPPRLFGRRGLMTFSLIAALSELTGWTDLQIGQLLGMARSNVQAFRTGRLRENLTEEQRTKILEAAKAHQAQVNAAVAEIELYS